MSVEFDRGSPGKFDSRTLSRETLRRWTGRISQYMCTINIIHNTCVPYIINIIHVYIYIYIYIYIPISRPRGDRKFGGCSFLGCLGGDFGVSFDFGESVEILRGGDSYVRRI